jgi:anti-sigma factor ChrR (cupin superfamily)
MDFEPNRRVTLVTFAPGASLPLHYHTGPADLNTLTIRVIVDSVSAAQGPPCPRHADGVETSLSEPLLGAMA